MERYWGYLSKSRAGMMLPGDVLDEEEKKREDLTETQKVYTQAMRLMIEKDSQLAGLSGIPIVCGAVKVEQDEKLVINGKEYCNNAIAKKDFEKIRKILTANTLKATVQKKEPELAKSMTRAMQHTEIRKHALIIRKCCKKLDGKVCGSCRRRPHTMPPTVVKDLPPRKLGSGARFWDVTRSEEHPGHFSTFLETTMKRKPFVPDSTLATPFGRCSVDRCATTFTSTAGAERHLKHGESTLETEQNKSVPAGHGLKTKEASAPEGYFCEFEVSEGQKCGLHFATRSRRDKHKASAGHLKKRKAKERVEEVQMEVEEELQVEEDPMEEDAMEEDPMEEDEV